MTIFASPLNPNTAYLTLQVSGAQTCPSTSSAAIASRSSTICQPQFVTTDGGATWQALRLPAPGILGVVHSPSPLSHDVSAQGTALYGIVTDTVIGASGLTPPGRLVVSVDGGVHWSSCDASLAAQGQRIYNFAVPPSGSTIFVIAEPANDPSAQAPTYSPTLSTWMSPNGGATWIEGGSTSGSGQPGGMPITTITAGIVNGRAVLYILDVQKGIMSLIASADGRTWKRDSQFPQWGVTGGEIPALLGTLPDGSAVVEQPAGSGPTLAWQIGGSYRVVAQNASMLSFFNPVFQQRPDGVYLWLSGYGGTSNTPITKYTRLQI